MEKKKFLLRLTPKLHAELRGWAAQEMRSLNGQIEFLLRDAAVKRRKRLALELKAEGEAEESAE